MGSSLAYVARREPSHIPQGAHGRHRAEDWRPAHVRRQKEPGSAQAIHRAEPIHLQRRESHLRGDCV